MTSAKKNLEGFTDEERAALNARAREVKSARRTGAREADGEADVIAKIAEMPEPDRTLAERLHAIIKASAPMLVPRTWYGMPAYAKDAMSSASFRAHENSRPVTRPWDSATRRTSMTAQCGRPHSP